MADELSNASQGFIQGIIESIMNCWARNRSKQAKKRLLLNMLGDPTYEWRSIETLQRAIRDDIDTTRDLLREIGARPSELPREMWKLE